VTHHHHHHHYYHHHCFSFRVNFPACSWCSDAAVRAADLPTGSAILLPSLSKL